MGEKPNVTARDGLPHGRNGRFFLAHFQKMLSPDRKESDQNGMIATKLDWNVRILKHVRRLCSVWYNAVSKREARYHGESAL